MITYIYSIQSLQCFHAVPSVHYVTPTFWNSFLFTFKNSHRSNVTFFLLRLPVVRSSQCLNTRSVEASGTGKASISRANDARIEKRWLFFSQKRIPPSLLFNYDDRCIQVHAQNFSLIDKIVWILVVVIVSLISVLVFVSLTKTTEFSSLLSSL